MTKIMKRSRKKRKRSPDENCCNHNKNKHLKRKDEDEKDAEPTTTPDPFGNEYKMDHNKRGRAIIFNHVYCDGHIAPRRGTEKDVDRLEQTLTNHLKFQVIVYTDLTHGEIMDTLECLSQDCFENEDCLAIFVLTHGSLHKLTAKDITYSIEDLWQYFTPDKCISLAGKPKLFFVNACRGKKTDEGVLYENLNQIIPNVAEDTNCGCNVFRIPIYADFLTFYSTMEGYISVRHARDGTWFIQSFCETIEDKNFRKLELKEILTIVARKTALKCNTYGENVCQIPTLMSTLIRNVYFF